MLGASWLFGGSPGRKGLLSSPLVWVDHFRGDINANGVVWASMLAQTNLPHMCNVRPLGEDVIMRKRYLVVSAYYLAVARSIHALFS